MLEIAVAAIVPAAVVAPHLVPLHRVSPSTAACVWLLALALRALAAIGGAIFFLIYMPQTGAFEALADWCLHEVLPILTTHLGLSGHPLAHAASVLPGLALALSVLWLLFGIGRAWVALHRMLTRAVGEGPHGSTVVRDERVLVGVTGVGKGRVLVSERALGAMDCHELEASLAHERGHINRRHRPLLLLGSFLGALARPLPGSRTAERELSFSLERDADEYALRRACDPLALASAICKAAVSTSPALAALGGRGSVSLRVEHLLAGAPTHRAALLERGSQLLAATLAALVLSLAATLPAWAVAAPGVGNGATPSEGCHHR